MRMDIVNMFRNKEKLIIAIEAIVIFSVFFVMLNRIQYGIDFTDESWYVAEPYAVAQLGAVPFVNNVTQTPGFTIPLALAFKLYICINGTTAGIVLFSRVFYIVVHFVISVVTVWVVNRYTSYKVPWLAIGALLAANHCYSLYDLSYNTIGMIYLPLIMAFVFAEYNDDSKRSIIWGILAGVLAVRVTMGTPQIIVGLVVVLLYLCSERKRKRITGIIIGASITCLILALVISTFWGLDRICNWFFMFFHQIYFEIESRAIWGRTQTALITFFRPALMLAVGFAIVRKKTNDKPCIFCLVLRIVIVGSVLIGILFSVLRHSYYGFYLMSYTWALPFLLFLFGRNYFPHIDKIVIINVAYLLIFFFSSFTTIYGFKGDRAYWNVAPLLLTLCYLVNSYSVHYDLRTLSNYLTFGVCIGSYAIFALWCQYSYVYRDSPIRMLSTKITDGVWKGLYTTEKRAENVITLERYIQSITTEEDQILCLDQVPFGYLMLHGKMCSPTTADASAYTYNVNNPNPYFLYFKVEGDVPNKILYIDFGRDKHVSIDDTEWRFNELIKGYYQFVSEYRNELFSVREYVLDSREGALQLVNRKLLQ